MKVVAKLTQHTVCSKMEPEERLPDVRAEAGLKTFSCLVCRQRKVRCDHAQPCGNCRRANIDCEYVAPVRGKRKMSNAPRETLHAKLRRYEDMLKARGADVAEPTSAARAASESVLSEGDETMESPASLSVPTPGDEPAPPMGFRSALIKTPGTGPRLVTKEGNTRYYEKYLAAPNTFFLSCTNRNAVAVCGQIYMTMSVFFVGAACMIADSLSSSTTRMTLLSLTSMMMRSTRPISFSGQALQVKVSTGNCATGTLRCRSCAHSRTYTSTELTRS